MLLTEEKKILNKFNKAFSEEFEKSETEVFYSQLLSQYPIHPLTSKKAYDRASKTLQFAMEYLELNGNTISGSVKKAFHWFISLYGQNIRAYEEEKFEKNVKKIKPSDVLEFLMDQHNLQQEDLSKDLGGQSVVSNICNGKRELNTKQIKALMKRFNVPASVFF